MNAINRKIDLTGVNQTFKARKVRTSAQEDDIRQLFHQTSGGLNGIDLFGEQMADIGHQITRLGRWIKNTTLKRSHIHPPHANAVPLPEILHLN